MPFLTSLIIFFGFVLVICLGLAQVIWDLSEISAHASPHMLATPHGKTCGAEDGRASANESSSTANLRDT
jgi:hypothetical protein